ncbi:hypothetical protein MMC30_001523 [Trapelia coarctata]|nr:hypothetical protein [Trapelia coarctata]
MSNATSGSLNAIGKDNLPGEPCKSGSLVIATPWGDSQITLNSILGVPSDTEGHRFYATFLHQVVPAFSKSLDAAFWQTNVLRNSASRPAVQNAAIALGALYEQRQGQFDGYALGVQQSLDSALPTSLLACRYSTAIRSLRDRLTHAVPDEDLMEEIMIACLLFVCIEILRDDDIAAVTHLEGALGIYLNVFKSPQDMSIAGGQPRSWVTNAILKIYTRLDIQAAAYIGSRSTRTSFEDDISDTAVENSNITFHTMSEAHSNLNIRLTSVLAFITPLYGAEKAFPGWTPHPLRGWDRYCVFHGSQYRDYAPPQVSIFRRRYMKLLSIWRSAFLELLQREKDSLKRPDDMAEVALMWSSYYTARIRLLASYTKDEAVYDQCLPQFKKIVEQAELVRPYDNALQLPLPIANGLEGNGKVAVKKILSPKRTEDPSIHMGFNYPLYFTALKCRYRPLRRRAMKLLRMSGRESVWDGNMLACIAEYVIQIEEGKGFQYKKGTEYWVDSIAEEGEDGEAEGEMDFGVSEEKRVHCLALNIDKGEKKIWVQFNRRVPNRSREDDAEGNQTEEEQAWTWRIDSEVLSW